MSLAKNIVADRRGDRCIDSSLARQQHGAATSNRKRGYSIEHHEKRATRNSLKSTRLDCPVGAGRRPRANEHAQMNMEAMMYWGEATVIRWSVVGDYEGEDLILNAGTRGCAPVKDHVQIVFEYTSEGIGGLLGSPVITNSTTEMGALRNGEDKCEAPTISSGNYEHATIESIEDGLGGQLAMMVRTDYPAGSVPVTCSGKGEFVQQRSSSTQEELPVPGIMMLAMGAEANSAELQVAKDGKSIIVRRNGWTYTFTPSKVR